MVTQQNQQLVSVLQDTGTRSQVAPAALTLCLCFYSPSIFEMSFILKQFFSQNSVQGHLPGKHPGTDPCSHSLPPPGLSPKSPRPPISGGWAGAERGRLEGGRYLQARASVPSLCFPGYGSSGCGCNA